MKTKEEILLQVIVVITRLKVVNEIVFFIHINAIYES